MCRHAVDETTRYLEEIHAHGDAMWDEWVALHFYNNHEDIERFTVAVRHVLGKG